MGVCGGAMVLVVLRKPALWVVTSHSYKRRHMETETLWEEIKALQ